MSKKPAAIPLFGDAYLADTQHLTTEEHGAYLLLMMAAWRQDDCALPLDDRKLARIACMSPRKWACIRSTILEFWDIQNGRIVQKRLQKEWLFVRQKSESKRKNIGKRWEKQRTENIEGGGYESIYEVDTPPPPPIRDKSSVEADASTAADAACDPPVDEPDDPPPTPPPVEAIDVVKVIFDTGTALLTATGVPERKARSVIGRWRKQFGDSVVLVSLSRCQVEGPSEPIEWMAKSLQSEQGRAGGNGHEQTQDLFGGTPPRHGTGVFRAVERGFDLLDSQLPDKGGA